MSLDHAHELLTVHEAATYLRVSAVTIKRYLKQGRLRASHLSPRAVRIRRQDLEQILAPTGQEAVEMMQREQRLRVAPPTHEEVVRRQQLLQEILTTRAQASIAPLTTAELVRRAREEEPWYDRDR